MNNFPSLIHRFADLHEDEFSWKNMYAKLQHERLFLTKEEYNSKEPRAYSEKIRVIIVKVTCGGGKTKQLIEFCQKPAPVGEGQFVNPNEKRENGTLIWQQPYEETY